MPESDNAVFGTCPLPKAQYEHVLLGHGGGGQLTAELIRRLFVPGFGGAVLAALEDQATLELPWPASLTIPPSLSRSGAERSGVRGPKLAFTTDAFVVRPLFFPGGDIGRLAVCGTVNDLAV